MTSYRVVFDSTQTQAHWFAVRLGTTLVRGWVSGAAFMAELACQKEFVGNEGHLGCLVLCGLVRYLHPIREPLLVGRHIVFSPGTHKTVEGPVRKYLAKQMTDASFEQFMLGNVPFGYPDIGRGKCFHQTAQNGGPIREGLQVQVGYTDSLCIAKLEVAE